MADLSMEERKDLYEHQITESFKKFTTLEKIWQYGYMNLGLITHPDQKLALKILRQLIFDEFMVMQQHVLYCYSRSNVYFNTSQVFEALCYSVRIRKTVGENPTYYSGDYRDNQYRQVYKCYQPILDEVLALRPDVKAYIDGQKSSCIVS